ncbi:MAG: hypothetical protein ABIJ48_02230 [Actinomycetota bacterium]
MTLLVGGGLVALPLVIDRAEVTADAGPSSVVTVGPGVTGKTIRLGVILTSTDGADGAADASLLAGHRYYWETAELGEWSVELVVAAAGDSQQALTEVQDQVLGVSLTDATGVLVGEAGALGLPLAADSRFTVWGSFPHVVQDPLGSSYALEIANATYWAARVADPPLLSPGDSPSLVVDGGPYGDDCRSGLEAVSAELGLGEPVVHTVPPGGPSGEVVAAIAARDAPLLLVCIDPAGLAWLLAEHGSSGSAVPIIAASASYDDRLPALVAGGEAGDEQAEAVGLGLFERLLLADSAPGGENSTMAALIEAVGRDVGQVDQHFLMGYRRAAAWDALIRVCLARGHLSREALIAAQLDGVGREPILGEEVVGAWFGPAHLVNTTTAVGHPVPASVSPFGTARLTAPLAAGQLLSPTGDGA